MRTRLTPHFAVEEFRCRDGTPYPPEWIDERLRRLCELLETVRAELGGKPIRILSGYRTRSHNRRVGGARRSQHMEGRAADIVINGVRPPAVHAAVLRLRRAGALPLLGGLGRYPRFIHVDIRPRAPGQGLVRWAGRRLSS